MTEVRRTLMSGGCQCGAVRYALYAEPHDAHVCHCRMCQKAFGSYFAPLAAVSREDFAVTRGQIALFHSSDAAERGFCRDCGTPLTFRYPESDNIDFALGSLDEPARVVPEKQFGIEARMPWFGQLAGLPASRTEEDAAAFGQEAKLAVIRATNRQHPDHDTSDWPPKDRAP